MSFPITLPNGTVLNNLEELERMFYTQEDKAQIAVEDDKDDEEDNDDDKDDEDDDED